MSGLHGSLALIRASLRRDRVRIIVWVLSITVMVWASASSVKGLFPTQADLDTAAAASKNPAVLAFNGPAQALDTLGGQVAFQIGSPGLVITALMSIFMIGHLTRGEEEPGRLELVRSLPVGRQAPMVAAVVVVTAMSIAVGALVTGALIIESLDTAGSMSFGLGYTLIAMVFMGVALVAGQISENTRLVYGLAGIVLGAAFIVRAVGDVGNSAVSWFSPIGWMQKARPFAGERWWPFLPALAAVAALVGAATAMLDHRDLGAGLVAPRRGRPTASRFLTGPVALNARLQRGSLLGWTFGISVTGVAYGSIANSIETFVQDNKAMSDLLVGSSGASLVDAYLATSTRVAALIGAGFAVQSMLRLRSEEAALRAEPVLATAVSRVRWATGHLGFAIAGSVIVLLATGLSTGISAALVTHDSGLVPRVVVAALAYSPAVWLLVCVALATIGLVPRAAPIVWALLVASFVVTFLGPLLSLPGWATNVSPFEHLALLPGAPANAVPYLALIAVAGGLALAGIHGLSRRDIG